MENINNASENPNSKAAFLNALSVELNEIRTVNEMILHKNTDLFAQIAACEARQGYVKASLAEGERIAQEVTRNAEIRVENILAKAQKVLVPQREQIACIEHELIELTEEMNAGALVKVEEESATKVTEIANIRREFSLREPQYSDFSDDNQQMGQKEVISPDPQPVVRREFSLREPQPMDISEDIPVVNQPEQKVPEPKLAAGREFSLREPQQLDISIENIEPNQWEQNEQYQQPQSALQAEYSMMEPLVEEISNYDLSINLMEQNESNMHLDAFVDLRYFAAQGEQTGQIQKHSWQVKIEVEVPTDNREFVGYGKVSAAVTSTLLRYDDVVLNDIFPFDIIEPNPENIAMYFYNCLEDTVSLMGLTLKEITLWDSQKLIMEVTKRKLEFDDLLQGDDILQDIRSLLAAREQEDIKTDTVLKGKLGYIFKK